MGSANMMPVLRLLSLLLLIASCLLKTRAEVLIRGENCVMVREGDSINIVDTKGSIFSQLIVKKGEFTQDLVSSFISHSACKDDIQTGISKEPGLLEKHFGTL